MPAPINPTSYRSPTCLPPRGNSAPRARFPDGAKLCTNWYVNHRTAAMSNRLTIGPMAAESARERDPERTRAEILAVATREFARHGYAGARVDDMAERM